MHINTTGLNKFQRRPQNMKEECHAARALAAKTYSEALAMGIGPIAEHAKRLLENDSPLIRWKQNHELLKAEDVDVQPANQSDEELPWLI